MCSQCLCAVVGVGGVLIACVLRAGCVLVVVLARRALDALDGPGAPRGTTLGDVFGEIAPAMGRVGDVALLRRPFDRAWGLPEDRYGSSGNLVRAYAEAFGTARDPGGVDLALAARIGHCRQHLPEEGRVWSGARVRGARPPRRRLAPGGHGLHRHFEEPWAVDLRLVALAESGRAEQAARVLPRSSRS